MRDKTEMFKKVIISLIASFSFLATTELKTETLVVAPNFSGQNSASQPRSNDFSQPLVLLSLGLTLELVAFGVEAISRLNSPN